MSLALSDVPITSQKLRNHQGVLEGEYRPAGLVSRGRSDQACTVFPSEVMTSLREGRSEAFLKIDYHLPKARVGKYLTIGSVGWNLLMLNLTAKGGKTDELIEGTSPHLPRS